MTSSVDAIPRGKRPIAYFAGRGLVHLALIAGSLVFALPFLWLLSTSFKTQSEIFGAPLLYIPQVFRTWPLEPEKVFANFISAQRFIPFWLWIGNTFYVTALNVVLDVLASSLVAFGFARVRWRGRNLVFLLVLATLMLPAQVTMIPQFLIFNSLGWYNTLKPLWVGAFFGSAMHIFLLRQFMLTLPMDLDEAAKIDGCSYFRIWRTITLPPIKPALAVVAIQTFQGAWNNFLGPYIYINNKNNMTISLGLQWFRADFASLYGELMATTLLMIIPVILLFLFCQRYMIQGISLTGIKG